jgi:hypothetical protein
VTSTPRHLALAESADLEPAVPTDRWATAVRRVSVVVAVALVVLILILRIAPVVTMSGPVANADEASYLVTARSMVTDALPSIGRFAPGYSLLVSPAFVLADDPLAQYRLVLALNALLALVGMGFVALIARRVLDTSDRVMVLLVVVAVAALPSWLAYSPLAMSENALIPLFAGVLLLAATPFRSRPTAALVAIGMAAGVVTSVHPRGVTIAVAVTVVATAVLRDRRSLAVAAGAGAGVLVSVLLHLVVYASIGDVGGGPIGSGASRLGGRSTRFDRWLDVPGTMLGQSGYLLLAGSFVLLVGVVVGARSALAVARGAGDGGDQLRAIAFVNAVAAAGITALFWAGTSSRADAAVHGRYNEPAALLLVLIGVLAVIDRARRPRWRAWLGQMVVATVVGLVVALGTARLLVPEATWSRGVVRVDIVAIGWMLPGGAIDLPRMLLAGAAVAVVVGAATMADVRLGLVAVVVLGTFVHLTSTLPRWSIESTARASERVITDTVNAYFADVECVARDRRDPPRWHLFNTEFFLAGRPMEPRDPTVARPSGPEEPCQQLMISTARDLDVQVPGARLVMMENHASENLWVLPGGIDRFEHLPFPGDPAARLTADSAQARITVIDRPARGLIADDRIVVEIVHVGEGSPWPNRQGLKGPVGFVQVEATWFAGEVVHRSVADLPRTMLPGDAVTVAITLDAVELGPGEYEVAVGLVQQGIARFAHDDDAVGLTVTVLPG